MADFPDQGGQSGSWGTDLINFFKIYFQLDGTYGGEIAIVCKDNQVVCKNNQTVTKTDRSVQ